MKRRKTTEDIYSRIYELIEERLTIKVVAFDEHASKITTKVH